MTLALEILKWWFLAACVVLPFALALARANGPDRETTRIRIIAVDGEIVRRG